MTNSNGLLREYLNQFYQLNDREFELFSSYFFIKQLSPKEALIREGDVEENIYYIIKGILRKYFCRNSEQIISGFFKENEICTSTVSYFTGLPSVLNIEAIEPTVCIGIKRSDLEFLLTQIPGLEKIFRGILTTLYLKKDIDKMNNLRYSKKERFLLFCEKQPELLQRIPQKQLASYLEITPETFCRMKRVRYELAKEARQLVAEDEKRA